MTTDKIKLFIVDRDAIFRLGLRTAISQYNDFTIVGEGDTSNETFRQLTQGLILNVLVIGISDRIPNSKITSLEFCQQFRELYPQLPIFLLVSNLSAKQQRKIESWGIRGYCDRTSSINQIVSGLHCVAYGDTYWQSDRQFRSPKLWQKALSRLSKSGRIEIEITLEEIDRRLSNRDLSDWERVFLVGRRRELLAARWLSNRLTAEEIVLESEQSQTIAASKGELVLTKGTELAPLPTFTDSANKTIYERTVTNIQLGSINRTDILLEIDILRGDIQKSLCHLIIKRLSDTVDRSNIATTSDRNYSDYLQSLWRWSFTNFFSQYYGQILEESQINYLLDLEYPAVKRNIFDYIYGINDLLEYLGGKPGLRIDNVDYPSDDAEAIARIEFLLHNLVINLANGVVQVILNNFYDVEKLKYQLYKAEYKSDREIARFRNQLSWKYRQEYYFTHPQNIFESRHRLLVLDTGRIRTLYVYAPRKPELERLTGIPWFTTIAIEVRDAIAPLVRKFIALAGSGVVFILTRVIGRGLGLIGKGIIQGIGSTLKDVNYKGDRR